MQCQEWGHFKCSKESKSNLIKLSFGVEGNLNEFFVSEKLSYKGLAAVEETKERKRDTKRKTKVRRLSNSNILIPTSDEASASSDDGSSSSGDEDQHGVLKKYQNRKQVKATTQMQMQCCSCAGYHETAECPYSARGNARYARYDDVRTRYANDMHHGNGNYQNLSRKYEKYQDNRGRNDSRTWQDQILSKRKHNDHQSGRGSTYADHFGDATEHNKRRKMA